MENLSHISMNTKPVKMIPVSALLTDTLESRLRFTCIRMHHTFGTEYGDTFSMAMQLGLDAINKQCADNLAMEIELIERVKKSC